MTVYDKLEEQPEDDTIEDLESKQDVILKIPEENITLNDGADIYHYDIHFESTITDGSEKVTSIDIEGVTTNNSNFFQKGHNVILSVRFKNLMVDITTAVIDEVSEDNGGVHLLVTEQLSTPSPVKDGDKPEEVPEKEPDSPKRGQQHENTSKKGTKKYNWDKITVSIPEEHLTFTDEDEFDITFDTNITDLNVRVTVINIKGINSTYFFNTGHTLTLTTQAGDLAGNITTGVIDDVDTDEDGFHVWVNERLSTPLPVKDERGAELKHDGINSDPNHTKEHNQHRPWEQDIREDIMARCEDPNDYVIQHSRNTPKCPKGEPGVEGMKTTIKVGNGSSSIVSDGDTITLNGDKIILNGEEVPKADHLVLKGVKITLGDITLNADELVFDGHINLNEANKV